MCAIRDQRVRTTRLILVSFPLITPLPAAPFTGNRWFPADEQRHVTLTSVIPAVGGRPEDVLKAAATTVNSGNYGQIGRKEEKFWRMTDGISLSGRDRPLPKAQALGPSRP